jgi:hypothetical protein
MEWDGFTPLLLMVRYPILDGISFVCRICEIPPTYFANCSPRIYYVFGRDNMTCSCVHLGLHEHPIEVGKNQEFKERMHTLNGEQVKRTSKATNSAIGMETTKELVEELLLHSKDALGRKSNPEELVLILNKYKYMSLLSTQNEVTTFMCLQIFGIMDSITMLKGCSH